MPGKDLWTRWIEAKSQTPLLGNEIINERKEYPAHYLSAKDVMRFLSSDSPWELFQEPDPRANQFDYPTSAINKSPAPWNSDMPEVAMLNQGVGEQSPWAPLYPVQQLGPGAAQGVYEHEYGHYKDPRPNPYKANSFPNHGFTTFGGLSGGLLQREFPAMVAEENYWHNNERR